jgi:hypothetical protein
LNPSDEHPGSRPKTVLPVLGPHSFRIVRMNVQKASLMLACAARLRFKRGAVRHPCRPAPATCLEGIKPYIGHVQRNWAIILVDKG